MTPKTRTTSTTASLTRQCTALDRRLLTLEILVRGEHGENGLKAQVNKLCERFDVFERKAIRIIAIGTALPAIVIAVVAVLRFLGRV